MKLEERMNHFYDSMTANDQYICQCILHHKEDCIALSIEEFANKYHVSTSTLSRFAQKLDLPGYSELRTMIRLDKSKIDSTPQDVEQVIACYQKVIEDIEHKDCSVVFERMKQANRIIVYGEHEAQGRVAKEMKRIFLPTGIRFYDAYGEDVVEALSQFVEPTDLVFFISLHGEQEKMVEFAKAMKLRGIYCISMTKMKSNPLSQVCDESLYIQSLNLTIDEQRHYEITTPYFILIELLYIKYKYYWKT